MGPKKGRKNVRRIMPTDTPSECQLGDTVADIQSRRNSERNETEKQLREEKEKEEARMWKNFTVRDGGGSGQRSESDMDTEGRGEVSVSIPIQAQEESFSKLK